MRKFTIALAVGVVVAVTGTTAAVAMPLNPDGSPAVTTGAPTAAEVATPPAILTTLAAQHEDVLLAKVAGHIANGTQPGF
jgi:hypothetical protein